MKIRRFFVRSTNERIGQSGFFFWTERNTFKIYPPINLLINPQLVGICIRSSAQQIYQFHEAVNQVEKTEVVYQSTHSS